LKSREKRWCCNKLRARNAVNMRVLEDNR
jgi:hypothetical protein